MDISSRETYREASATVSLASARDFVQRCRNAVANLQPWQRLVEPVVTPRFVPTCSDELLEGLGKLCEELGLRAQSHLAEAYDEVMWVKDERHIDDIEVFDKVGKSIASLVFPPDWCASMACCGRVRFKRTVHSLTLLHSRAWLNAKRPLLTAPCPMLISRRSHSHFERPLTWE